MKTVLRRGAALAALCVTIAGPASGQTIKRDTKVTGPKGHTAERQINIQRGPGYVNRDVKITRPGGATFERDTTLQRAPIPTGGRRVMGGGGFGGPRIVENNYYVGRPRGGPSWGTAVGIGGGLFGLGLLAGNALAAPPPPPPVVYVPAEPVVVAPPPTVVYNPPVRYATPPPPATVVVDPVADAMGRLSSNHDNSRRDGCYTLGRLGDVRAVGPLVDRLKNDSDREVRVAAAWALGEIGDPRAAVYLERAASYDKKREVRDAAALAIGRLPRAVAAAPAGVPTTVAPAPLGDDLAPLPESASNTPPPPPRPYNGSEPRS